MEPAVTQPGAGEGRDHRTQNTLKPRDGQQITPSNVVSVWKFVYNTFPFRHCEGRLNHLARQVRKQPDTSCTSCRGQAPDSVLGPGVDMLKYQSHLKLVPRRVGASTSQTQ